MLVGGVCWCGERGGAVSVVAAVVLVLVAVGMGVVVGGCVAASLSSPPLSLRPSPCDGCARCVEAFDRGEVACRHSSDANDAVGGGGQEKGREWRRGRGVECWVGAWWVERTAKGLAM